MSEIKNRQHYVFKAYIDNWLNDYGKTWCLDKKSSRIFPSGTDNILNKRQMYRIQELNSDERIFLKLLLRANYLSENQQKEMFFHVDEYLLPHSSKKMLEKLKEYNPIPDDHPLYAELMEDFDNLDSLLDKQIVNNEEDFYSDYEGDGIKWIKSLIEGDSDFYYDDEKKADFQNFLCIQYFRTIGMRNLVDNNIRQMIEYLEDCRINDDNALGDEYRFNINNINSKHILPHLIWIIQTKLSAALTNASIQIIRNETSLPFITSDQPIINMLADVNGEPPKDVRLYYPLSPKVAIIVNGDCGEKTIDNKNEVDDYNGLIWKLSFQYIVSNKKEVLEGMLDMYC